MEKSVTSIKELVVQTLTNGSEIKANAVKGDAFSCFQMGMIHLLGINTPIDFKKASMFLSNQSLSDDPNSNRLLGFIAECEGKYSQAFKNYAKAGKSNRPFFNKVFEERTNLQSYFKKLNLPSTVQNKIITNILNEYIKGGDNKVETSIRIAMICEDETSCLDVAQALSDVGDYYSAMRWLQNGNIPESNTLYASVKKKFLDSKDAQNLPYVLDVIEIDGNSFLANNAATPSYAGIKHLCDEKAVACKNEWIDTVSSKITAVIQREKDEEAARIKRLKDEEAARIKRLKDEEAARIKKQQDEEAARIKKKQREKTVDIILLAIFVPWNIFCLLFSILVILGAISNGNSVLKTIIIVSVIYFGVVLFPCSIIKLLSVLIINGTFASSACPVSKETALPEDVYNQIGARRINEQ